MTQRNEKKRNDKVLIKGIKRRNDLSSFGFHAMKYIDTFIWTKHKTRWDEKEIRSMAVKTIGSPNIMYVPTSALSSHLGYTT